MPELVYHSGKQRKEIQMHRMLTAFVLTFGLILVAAIPASAGCTGGPCAAYIQAKQWQYIQKLQPPYAAPATKIAAKSSGTIRVEVLNNSPDALVLYKGRTRSGDVLKSFTPQWRKTNEGYVATITFSASLIAGKSTVALCDGDGQSVWSRGEISYLLAHGRTPPGDKACTGGKPWCAKHGL